MTQHPGASSYSDRHGVQRWRYRRKGKTISLPGAPGEPEFEEAYAAAVEGRPRRTAEVAQHPLAAVPRSFGAAWRIVRSSADWKRLDPATQKNNVRLTEGFLTSPILEGESSCWKDVEVVHFKRRHMKGILAERSATPHAAKHTMTAIRRLIAAALDEEWIEFDPTGSMKWRPEYIGRRAWTDEEILKFEERHPLGTNPRLIFALAIWLGNRRGDVARLRWDQRRTATIVIDGKSVEIDVFDIRQGKTGKQLLIPITPMLGEVLDATARAGETIAVTRFGKAYSEKSLTGKMRQWTDAAGLPKGCTLHGLRKTLGRLLAEGEASTRQIMDVLGHDDIEHAELYSREAAQLRLAHDGMNRVVALRRRG